MNQYYVNNHFTEKHPLLYCAIYNGIRYSTTNKRAYVRMLRYMRDGVDNTSINFRKFIARAGIGFLFVG